VDVELLAGTHVAPSILSADFARLGEQVREVTDAGARAIHVDVMDGHFVPPLTMGPPAVAALREQVSAVGGMLEVHLMVERPERHVAEFARAGADLITVHAEATPNVHYALHSAREAGAAAGLAICPATPVSAVSEALSDTALFLCMTVDPGWGGQPFIASSPEKIARLRAAIGSGPALEVDGGIEVATAGPCAQAGATRFVAGSAIFDAPDPGEAYRAIAEAVGAL
jgi:ribulose-phosphate 3-epimerase